MADKKPVSVNWQSLFIIIPIIDLWAAYRVEKFRIYFSIFWVGASVFIFILDYSLLGDRFWTDEGWFFSADPTVAIVQIIIMIAALGTAVYFIREWSKDWNSKLSKTTIPEKKETTDYVSGEDSSIELLKKRYAMGEISKEEFERMKKDLEN